MKRFITPLIVLGLVIIGVSIASYIAFPEWKNADGGVLYLLGFVIPGVIAIIKDFISIGKDLGWWGKEPDGKSAAETPQEDVFPHYGELKSRVFISYARSDGEEFANRLNQKIEAEGIPCWLDKVKIRGGQDWWRQIKEALNVAEYLVLVMTPGAVVSKWTHKEWNYARQQGVCVYPVMAAKDLDFEGLPRWMRDSHFYNLNQEWGKFINDLNTRCQEIRVPFMADDLPEHFVERPDEFMQIVDNLLDENREAPKAITTALRGVGGFGKTTLAVALCHDDEIQQAFHDGILWVTLGEKPGDLVGKVSDLIVRLSGNNPGYTSIEAASDHLSELLGDRDILMVVDDVWDAVHLRPFLRGGKRCTRLITTRNAAVLPIEAQSILVDAMKQEEAIGLLSKGLSHNHHRDLQTITTRLGEWPLLLKLVNARLRERVHNRGQELKDALEYINKALDKRGVTAFDIRDTEERSQAVDITLGLSLELLHGEDAERYSELAVFPEDADIPLATLEKYWAHTAGLDDLDTEELCDRFDSFSLLQHYDLTSRTIRLHDVVKDYLVRKSGGDVHGLHQTLLDAYGLEQWAELPEEEPYLWDYLAEHLTGANQFEELYKTVLDLEYLAKKTWLRKSYAVEKDLRLADQYHPTNETLGILLRNFRNVGHLLNQCGNLKDVKINLYNRLIFVHSLDQDAWEGIKRISKPYLVPCSKPPDLPHPALIRSITGHTGWVRAVAISWDRGTIISGSHDKTLRVWEMESGEVQQVLEGHTDWVNAVAISPDGNTIVSGSDDNTLRVWDAHSRECRHTLEGHTSWVRAVLISLDGSTIVSGSDDNTLRVWDAHSGECRHTLEGHKARVNAAAISPDGGTIASGSDDNTLRVWDAHSGECRHTLEGHTHSVSAVSISPDGGRIVSGSEDSTLRVWDVKSGGYSHTLKGHTGAVRVFSISPDGKTIVSGSDDKCLRVWDAKSGECRRRLEGHLDWINAAAISEDGGTIISGSDDSTLRVWDAHSGECRHTLEGHTGWVRAVSISADGGKIVSGSDDHTVRVWDAHSGKVWPMPEGHTGSVKVVSISPDGGMIVSGSLDKSLRVWDAKNGKCRHTLEGHTGWANALAISPDGSTIISGSVDHTLRIWDAGSGEGRHTLEGHTRSVNAVSISPDGSMIVSGSSDRTLRVWDTERGECRHTLEGHTGWVNAVAISPDGVSIASSSDDKTLRVWDAHSGECRHTLEGHKNSVRAISISPDGGTIVSGSDDSTLRVWDVKSGECHHTLKGHWRSVSATAISPDGGTIISGSDDKTLRVWDAASGELRHVLKGHTGWVRAVSISPDGSTILSGSFDHTLRVWDAESGRYYCGIFTEGSLHDCQWHPDGTQIAAGGDAGVYFLKYVK